MKVKVIGALVLAIILSLLFVSVALAVSQSTIDAIITDAKDGKVDGNWTAAEVTAALEYVKSHPLYDVYSGLQGVLEDFLASDQAPGTTTGDLAFTGSELLLVLGAGVGLIGAGILLRRRAA